MNTSKAGQGRLGVLEIVCKGKVAVLNMMVRIVLIEKMAFEQKLEGDERISLMIIWGRNIHGKGCGILKAKKLRHEWPDIVKKKQRSLYI